MNKVVNNYRCGMLIMVALVFFSSSCYGKTNNRKDHELRGSVYTAIVKDIKFSIEFGEIKSKGVSDNTYIFFSKNGNVYKEVLLPNWPINGAEKPKEKTKIRYAYDKHNNLIDEMTINIGAGKTYEIGNYTFHKNDTANCYHYENTYNNDNTISVVKTFYKSHEYQEQTSRIVYTYTHGGRKESYYNQSGIEKEVLYKGKTRITKDLVTITEILNENGKPISMEAPLLPIPLMIKGGNVKEIFKYNEYGDEVKVVNTKTIEGTKRNYTETKIKTTQYVYDKKGNWVCKKVFKDGKLISWVEREVYYATSDADYLKVVEAEEKAIKQEERVQYLQDSISNSISKRRLREEYVRDSIDQFESRLANVVEKEFFRKHITGILNYNSMSYEMNFVGINRKIRDCFIDRSAIVFIEKKGNSSFDAVMKEFRICRYSWDWDIMHHEEKDFWAWYSQDLTDILLYIEGVKKKGLFCLPMIVVLHKEGEDYTLYSVEKDAYEKIVSEIPLLKANQIKSQSVHKLTRR